MGVYQEKFGLNEYPEELIETIVGYRMSPYGITGPYLSCAEIAAQEQVSPEDAERILRATAIVWGH